MDDVDVKRQSGDIVDDAAVEDPALEENEKPQNQQKKEGVVRDVPQHQRLFEGRKLQAQEVRQRHQPVVADKADHKHDKAAAPAVKEPAGVRFEVAEEQINDGPDDKARYEEGRSLVEQAVIQTIYKANDEIQKHPEEDEPKKALSFKAANHKVESRMQGIEDQVQGKIPVILEEGGEEREQNEPYVQLAVPKEEHDEEDGYGNQPDIEQDGQNLLLVHPVFLKEEPGGADEENGVPQFPTVPEHRQKKDRYLPGRGRQLNPIIREGDIGVPLCTDSLHHMARDNQHDGQDLQNLNAGVPF